MSQYCGAVHDVSQSEHVAAKHDHLALSEICMEGILAFAALPSLRNPHVMESARDKSNGQVKQMTDRASHVPVVEPSSMACDH